MITLHYKTEKGLEVFFKLEEESTLDYVLDQLKSFLIACGYCIRQDECLVILDNEFL